MRQLYKFSESELSVLKRELKISGQPIHNLTRNYYFRAVKCALSGFDGTVLRPDVTYVKKMQGQMYRKAQRHSGRQGAYPPCRRKDTYEARL